MPFQYKCVLMIGATAGIGASMANRLVQEGSKVIAVGRRQDRLDDFVKRHGKDRASAVKFDISKRENIDGFVNQITREYPDLDCVFLNAGVQNPVNLAEPKKVDLSKFHDELAVNFSRFVDLTVKFLPFLMGKETETGLIYTGSLLAVIPAPHIPAYCASKAALNSFILSLREQLRDSSVKVYELWPPPVQTELHDYLGEESGRQFGMPVDAYVNEAYKGLASGKEEVITGSIGPADTFNEIVEKRKTQHENFAKMVLETHRKD